MQANKYQNSYFEKQESFKALVREIQHFLQSKEGKPENCSVEEYIRKKWNISKTQAYRYVISAKVIDQLAEFEIQPCYERICRALYNCAKTPNQMKLLWGSVLQMAGSNPDSINSSHVTKMWKKLCADNKYSKICHFEDEIMNKIEVSLNKHSKEMKHKQLNNLLSPKSNTSSPVVSLNGTMNNTNTMNNSNSQLYQYAVYGTPVIQNTMIPNESSEYKLSSSSYYPSPIQSESLTENIKQYSAPSPPLSVCNSTLSLYNSNSTLFNSDSSLFNGNSRALSLPTNQSINVIEYPMMEVQYPLQTMTIKNYQEQCQNVYQPTIQPTLQNQYQPQQILYYY